MRLHTQSLFIHVSRRGVCVKTHARRHTHKKSLPLSLRRRTIGALTPLLLLISPAHQAPLSPPSAGLHGQALSGHSRDVSIWR